MSNARRHAPATALSATSSMNSNSVAAGHTSSSASTTPSTTADEATITLIQNTLIPALALQKPLEETLPALTSFTAIDVELYAFIALILRQFVQGWYSKVTDDELSDKTFVYEVVHVVAHVTRSIEERLRKVELELLLLDDIPFVLDAHLRDYRLAKQKLGTAYANGKTFEEMFHALQPHPALEPAKTSKVPAQNGPFSLDDIERKFLGVLSKGILAVLLPSEDLGSQTERTLLRSLLAEAVLFRVIDKLSEPFMVHEIISTLIEKSLKNRPPAESSTTPVGLSDEKKEPMTTQVIDTTRTYISAALSFFSLLQAGTLFLVSFARSPLPEHPSGNPNKNVPSSPLLTIALFPTIARLLNLPSRQPWLMSTIELLALPLVSLPPGSIIDRLLSHFFKKYIMTVQFVCNVLAVSRQTLFPNNGDMAPPRVYPDDDEKRKILRRVSDNILRVVPARVQNQVLGDDAMQGVEALLSPFENKFANKHLLYFLFDMIIVKVLPELAEQTPEELKKWRLGEDERYV
ncbi:PXA domain-containing protein [Lipomyces arxii]|uniref:PXA domain-containing protein n=1 Tax=Lipomyces arxii TaxID=56418 RepID=UPI0034CE2D50